MKRKINFSGAFKALLVAGLLASPMLASNAIAADNSWSPLDLNPDGSANFADPNNWSLAVVPTNGDGNRVIIIGTLGSTTNYVACVITNNMADLYQLIMGDNGTAGGGILIVTNGAHVSFGVASGQWTGIGFPNGPGTLYVGPGCDFTCGSHLWVGQGTNNGAPAQGTVIIDGGSIHVPNGQLGVGWSGIGGTNYITLENGGQLYLTTWASQTLGYPGNTNSLGIMNLAGNTCTVVVTNNQTGYMNTLITNNQLIAYGGAGTIQYSYNPALNITTISAVAPGSPIITSQPANVVTSLGSTVSFTVTNNNVAVNYQWMFNGNPLSNGGGISGATTATLTVTGVTLAQLGSYSVKITAQSDSTLFTTSSPASLSTTGINLYPVVTVNGVPGNTYVTSWSATVNGTYTPFATNTVNSFAPLYVVDTASPMSVTRFYKTVQQ